MLKAHETAHAALYCSKYKTDKLYRRGLSAFDHASAAREGWALVYGDRRADGLQPVLIIRLHTPEAEAFGFETDDDAWEHVVNEAKLGSKLHRDAIVLAEQYNRSLLPLLRHMRREKVHSHFQSLANN